MIWLLLTLNLQKNGIPQQTIIKRPLTSLLILSIMLYSSALNAATNIPRELLTEPNDKVNTVLIAKRNPICNQVGFPLFNDF